MKSQQPLDRRHLKEVLHRNELTDELVEIRDWAKAHVEVVLVGVLLVAALVFGVYFFLNSRKQRVLDASMLLTQAQESFEQAAQAPPEQGAQAFQQAYFKYQSLASTYPDSIEARAAQLGMANADMALGKGSDAEAEYAKLGAGQAGDPIAALAALGRGRALELQGKNAEARAAYVQALTAYPSSAITAQAKAGAARLASAAPEAAAAPAPVPALGASLAAAPLPMESAKKGLTLTAAGH